MIDWPRMESGYATKNLSTRQPEPWLGFLSGLVCVVAVESFQVAAGVPESGGSHVMILKGDLRVKQGE